MRAEINVFRVPREEVERGVSLCRINALNLVEEAEQIIRMDSEGNRLGHAYALIQPAIEELGKGLFLKEALRSQSSSLIDVEEWLFGKGERGKKAHELKSNKAWEVLDKNLKIVHEGSFSKGSFSSNSFDTDVEASHETRLKCAYVDFDENRKCFRIGERLDKNKLLALANDIKSKIEVNQVLS